MTKRAFILAVVTYVLSDLMILTAWGIWAFTATVLISLFLFWLLKPRFIWQEGYASSIVRITNLIAGVVAVALNWHDPGYTATAVIVALVLGILSI